MLLESAMRALAVLAGLFRYDETTFRGVEYTDDHWGDGGARLPARVFLGVVSLIPRTVLAVLQLLTLRSGQRAEYLADQLGSKVGGSDATATGMEKLLLGESCLANLSVALRRPGRHDLWALERDFVRSFPRLELERLLKAAEQRGSRIDDSHPPTHLRIRLSRIPERRCTPAIVLGAAEAGAIERELAPAYEAVGADLRAELQRSMYR